MGNTLVIEVLQPPALEFSNTQLVKSLSNLSWSLSWPCFEQEVGLETSCIIIWFSEHDNQSDRCSMMKPEECCNFFLKTVLLDNENTLTELAWKRKEEARSQYLICPSEPHRQAVSKAPSLLDIKGNVKLSSPNETTNSCCIYKERIQTIYSFLLQCCSYFYFHSQ